jgi:hypothetical protein
MRALPVVLVLMALPSPMQAPVVPQDPWREADRATVRLAPEEFTELPRSLQRELRRRGCSIPQPYTNGGRQNVISGEFTRAGQIDWAALCSRERQSSILVFRTGDPQRAEELAPRADAKFLQRTDAIHIGFSRALTVASTEYIRQHQRSADETLVITHAGINDIFVDKASVVWYWDQRQWLQLSGAN